VLRRRRDSGRVPLVAAFLCKILQEVSKKKQEQPKKGKASARGHRVSGPGSVLRRSGSTVVSRSAEVVVEEPSSRRKRNTVPFRSDYWRLNSCSFAACPSLFASIDYCSDQTQQSEYRTQICAVQVQHSLSVAGAGSISSPGAL
jgi:hypothetical protein